MEKPIKGFRIELRGAYREEEERGGGGGRVWCHTGIYHPSEARQVILRTYLCCFAKSDWRDGSALRALPEEWNSVPSTHV